MHRRPDVFKARLAVEPQTGITTACELTEGAGLLAPDGGTGIRLVNTDDTLPALRILLTVRSWACSATAPRPPGKP